MVKPRKIKVDRLDQPPYRPLSVEEVRRIAQAGGIAFTGRVGKDRKFESSLDYLRREYAPEANQRKLSLTDSQINARLVRARNLARQLVKLLSEPAFNYQFFRLEDELQPWKDLRGLAPLEEFVARTELGLEKMKSRSPEDRWAQPEDKANQKTGFKNLLIGLMRLWQIETHTIAPQVARSSPLVKFLKQGAFVVAQQSTGDDTAYQWARSLLPHALKRIDIGHILFRPYDDPEVVRYLNEHGFESLKGLS